VTKSTVAVVCEAGPLIHLDELDRLSLLADFEAVIISEQVWQEVAQHRPQALHQTAVPLERTEVVISPQPAFQALVKALSLDLGEQAALSLMEQQPQAIFLTDDAAARLAAVTLGYRVHGTIGVLLRAVRRQQRSRAEVTAILQKLPTQSTLHIRTSLLQEIISKLNLQQ
jgi:predicted nucleic acid-binding protein